MRVGAAEPEGAGRSTARVGGLGPGAGLTVEVKGCLVPVDVIAGLIAAGCRWKGLVLHGPDRDERVDQAGGRLRVTDGWLDRHQRAAVRGRGGVGARQGAHLDGVPKTGARPMPNHQPQRSRLDTSGLQGTRDDVLLRGPARSCDAVAATVIVHGRRKNPSADPTTPPTRRALALKHQRDNRLTRHHAVGPGVVGTTPPSGREHLSVSHRVEGGRGAQHVGGRDDRGVAVALLQREPSLVQRDQARGARGIDGHAGTGQVKEVAQPRRKH